jgi:pSer/pThr/pTyr-binding forkhead associated (FHA) protein
VARGLELDFDLQSQGVPCPPEHVLRLAVRGITSGEAPRGLQPAVGTIFTIDRSPFWVGLHKGCFPDRPNDLILRDVGLSRNSCCFVFQRNGWYVWDNAGTTATTVNGRVADWTRIQPGDVICLGLLRCETA